LQRQEKKRFQSAIIVELVQRERKVAKRIGGKKLYQILKSEIEDHHIKIGRDAFFDVLRNHGLLVKKRKNYTQTTNSRHHLRKHPDLTIGLNIQKPENLWVSDITYIRTAKGFCYLILITDAYSRRVMGYNVSRTMDTEFCLVALNQAFSQRQYRNQELIHHSDRGLQYCSFAYTNALATNQVKISMTQNGDPYENALAERMNRTFKSEFDLSRTFSDLHEAMSNIDSAIDYYNNKLPHSSCNMMTPAEAHQHTGEMKKHWTKPSKKGFANSSKEQ